MRFNVKVAILKSGRPQYQLAQELGVSESRLSKYVRGYGTLQPDKVRKLELLLGMKEEATCEQGG